MSESWILRLNIDTPHEQKRLGWIVSALQHDAHVDRVEVEEGAGNLTIVEVDFISGETRPKGKTLQALNGVFGDGGVHRPSKWELLLADDELPGV